MYSKRQGARADIGKVLGICLLECSQPRVLSRVLWTLDVFIARASVQLGKFIALAVCGFTCILIKRRLGREKVSCSLNIVDISV